jgi:hypothetical protein
MPTTDPTAPPNENDGTNWFARQARNALALDHAERQSPVEAMNGLLTQTAAVLARLDGTNTELVSRLRGMAVNDVLFSGTLVIASDASLAAALDFQVPIGSVYVANLHATDLVTVHAAPLGMLPGVATPADAGRAASPGVHRVRAQHWAVLNLTGRELTFYGTAGTVLSVQVFAKPQTPAAGDC